MSFAIISARNILVNVKLNGKSIFFYVVFINYGGEISFVVVGPPKV